MGLFFKETAVPTGQAIDIVQQALQKPTVEDPSTARTMATESVDAAADGGGLRREAFVGAAIVFLVLLVAAFLAAQLADAQTQTSSYLQDLAGLLQTLLTAWSAAVLGLIGGEAVGKTRP